MFNQTNVYPLYEAIFLDNDEIESLFLKIRSTPPFEKNTINYHVTTEYMPSTKHVQFYGEEVIVHIISYKAEIIDDDSGISTANEGFKVELFSNNILLQKYIDSLDKNFHITGSYQTAAKYTEKISFSDGVVLDYYVTGKFDYRNIS